MSALSKFIDDVRALHTEQDRHVTRRLADWLEQEYGEKYAADLLRAKASADEALERDLRERVRVAGAGLDEFLVTAKASDPTFSAELKAHQDELDAARTALARWQP